MRYGADSAEQIQLAADTIQQHTIQKHTIQQQTIQQPTASTSPQLSSAQAENSCHFWMAIRLLAKLLLTLGYQASIYSIPWSPSRFILFSVYKAWIQAYLATHISSRIAKIDFLGFANIQLGNRIQGVKRYYLIVCRVSQVTYATNMCGMSHSHAYFKIRVCLAA